MKNWIMQMIMIMMLMVMSNREREIIESIQFNDQFENDNNNNWLFFSITIVLFG